MNSEVAAKKHVTRSAPPGYERMAEMYKRIGLSRSTIYRWLSDKSDLGFPQPIRLGGRISLFSVAQVDAWLVKHGIVPLGSASA
jgi:predicted DNA-binding transcriptional regulator AlpA